MKVEYVICELQDFRTLQDNGDLVDRYSVIEIPQTHWMHSIQLEHDTMEEALATIEANRDFLRTQSKYNLTILQKITI